jgi:DNA-binding NarL/FixJ family response regulator
MESRPEIMVVGEAGNGAEALAVVARTQPDIIVLDLDLGGESGLDYFPELRAAASTARVLVLTGVRDPELHRRAVRLGSMGLVLKEEAAEVLLQAIEKVHAGEVWLEPAMVASILGEMTEMRASR